MASVPELTPSAGEFGDRALEPIDFRAENEVTRAEHAQECLVQFRLERSVLWLEVEEIDVHRSIMGKGFVA
jgi:hypothetical protein